MSSYRLTKTQQRKEKRFLCTRRPGGYAAAALEMAYYQGQDDANSGKKFDPPYPVHAIARIKTYSDGYNHEWED